MAALSVSQLADKLLLEKGFLTSGELARAARMSRQAVQRHLRALIASGKVTVQGRGRAARYVAPTHEFRRRMKREGLAESDVWEEIRKAIPRLDDAAVKTARQVLGYAFTEMLNNAIDHSGSDEVEAHVELGGGKARFAILDEGIGVYESVRAAWNLPDAANGLQHLSKGKVTTQPHAHSGQGIFFTSKVADRFELKANGLRWIVDNIRDDIAVSDISVQAGTSVHFEVSLTTTTTLAEVSSRYSGDDLQFDTSRIIVKLFERGTEFVSRSEAKRIVVGLEAFRHVILDFKGIDFIGQGFADEIFRVWASAHPDIDLAPVAMSESVRFMIERSRPAQWATRAPTPTLRGASHIALADDVRRRDLPLGWSEESVAEVLEHSDAVTQLAPADGGSGLLIATRRNVRGVRWTFCGVVVASRGPAGTTALAAFILRRKEAGSLTWMDPVEALRRFLAVHQRIERGTAPQRRAVDYPRYARGLIAADVHIAFE